MITGREFAKTFSEVEDEKLFSTGDAELDGILTEVYYSGIEDGYDYAQREFGLKEAAMEAGEKIKEAGRKVGDAAGKGFVWMKTKTGQWVKVAKESVHDAAGKVAKGTKEAADKVAESAKAGADKVAEGAKAGAGKAAKIAKSGASWAKTHPIAATGIGLGTAALATGAAIGAKQLKKSKKEDK